MIRVFAVMFMYLFRALFNCLCLLVLRKRSVSDYHLNYSKRKEKKKATKQAANLMLGKAELTVLYFLHLVVSLEDVERDFVEPPRSLDQRHQPRDARVHGHVQQDNFRHVTLQELAACRHERQA